MKTPVTEKESVPEADISRETAKRRRKHDRFTYPVLQMICPCGSDVIPRPARFFPVKCKDLSRSGISFYLDWEPSFQRFILMIGTGDHHDYVAGEVVYVQAIAADAPGRYLVGCRLIKKLKSAAQAGEAE